MIKLNDSTIPSFVKVNKIDFSILPPIENKLLKVRGRKNAYFMSQEFGTRTIKVSITVVAEQINGVMSKARELASWLLHDKPVKLELADEPNKYYMVLLDGETDLNEIANFGQGELTFICTEPFAYGYEHTFNFAPTTEQPFEVVNTGNIDTHGVFELTMRENVSEISLVSDDGIVTVGTPTSVETEVIDTNPRVLWDQMNTLTGWTSGIAVDGTLAGSFTSTGTAFTGTYGTGSGWHGPALVKALPSQYQDFEIHFDFALMCNKKEQIGRIELYLYDTNNNVIGKIGFNDNQTSGEYQNFEVRAGTLAGGTYFVNERKKTAWTDFDGFVRLSRKGKTWEAWIGKWDSKSKSYKSRFLKRWTDTKGLWNAKLSKIQVHMAQHGTHAIPSTFRINDIKVFNRLTLANGQAPIIAKVGDVITVDNEKAVILKNGVPFYEGLNPDSNFFSLKQGSNGIILSPAKADVSVSYKERWL